MQQTYNQWKPNKNTDNGKPVQLKPIPQTIPEIRRNFKSRTRDPFATPLI